MPNEKEAQRIVQVYHHYQNDAAIQAQWRADNPGNRFILEERWRAMRDALQLLFGRAKSNNP